MGILMFTHFLWDEWHCWGYNGYNCFGGVLFMAKTAIVYYSLHHGNTKKILDVIAGYGKEWNCVMFVKVHL